MPAIERVCKITGEKFYVSELEQNLRKKFGVELPDIHPDERLRYLLAFRNLYVLYADTCDLCGKNTLSVWGENPEFPVYCHECWQSDKWKPIEMDIDLERSFFDQMKELIAKSPHPARAITNPIVNSEFCNAAGRIKNCYMGFNHGESEDCYYILSGVELKNCVDLVMSNKSELLYGCIGCTNSFQLKWCEFSDNCSESIFLYDCVDSTNCAFSTGLRHAQYVFKNQQLSKADYEKKVAELNLGSYASLQKHKEDFDKIKKQYSKKYLLGFANENVTGNIVDHSKDAENAFDGHDLENVVNSYGMFGAKDGLDIVSFGIDTENVYCSASVGSRVNNVKFCASVWDNVYNLDYCMMMVSSHDCFGSGFGLKMEHCILNKRYSEKEYKELKEKLIAKMKERGEYGKMFRPDLIFFAYNESIAQLNMPLSKEEAVKRGFRWVDRKVPKTPQDKIVVPKDHIQDVEWSDLEGKFLICEQTERPYRIVKQEFDFYKRHQLPLPRIHPEVRLINMYPAQIFFDLHEAGCSNCNKRIVTSMPPEDTLLCDDCYREKVI